jgi:hypothetical protein
VRAIESSKLFSSVSIGVVDPVEIDLRLRFDRGTVAVNRRVNLSYFPLALATLTLSIWLGGPIGTDIEFYETIAGC